MHKRVKIKNIANIFHTGLRVSTYPFFFAQFLGVFSCFLHIPTERFDAHIGYFW